MKRHADFSPYYFRLFMSASLIALASAACGGASCTGCMAPLESPIPEENMFNGAAQVRLTPSGIDFVSTNLPDIIQSMASMQCDSNLPDYIPCPDGSSCVGGDHCENNTDGSRLPLLGFRIPENQGTDSCETYVCHNASENECLVYVELNGFSIAPSTPNKLDIGIDTRIWSTDIPIELTWHWDCPVSPDCTYGIKNRQRPVNVPVHLLVDNPLQRMSMDIGDPEITLEDNDLSIDGHVGCDIIDLVKPLIFPLLEGKLRDALNQNISSTVISMSSESCAAPATCSHPAISYCDGDHLCRFDVDDSYVPALLGTEGSIDFASLLGDFAGEATGVDLSIGAGGYAEVVGEGVEVGLRGGTRVETAACAPVFTQSLPEPPRYDFGNEVADASGTIHHFMMGLGISDRFVEEIGDGAVRSGLLCQRIDSGLSSYINTGALGLLAGSLGRIARDGAKPALIEIKPRQPLTVDIGLGTSIPDPNDAARTIMDQPLFTLRAHDVDFDLYGYIDQRYVRFMTMRVDLAIGMGLDVDADNNLQIMMSGPEDWLQNVRVLNSELLSDDPDDIAAAVPSLIGTMLGQAAPDLNQVMPLPDLAGFQLRDLLIRGVMEHLQNGQAAVDLDGHNIYEFIGIFANLGFDPDAATAGGPLGYRVNTLAEIQSLHIPSAEAFSISHPGGPVMPSVYIRVDAEGDTSDTEYSYRVDGGFWRPYHRGHILHISDAQLQLMGRHAVEIRGRRVGAPETLDASPARVEVLIDPLAPELSLHRDDDNLQIEAHDALTSDEKLKVRYRFDAGQSWITQQGLRPVALGDGDTYVEVEVEDEAGNISRASLGEAAQALLSQTAQQVQKSLHADDSKQAVQVPQATGCSAHSAKNSGLSLMLVLGLALLWRRRRN